MPPGPHYLLPHHLHQPQGSSPAFLSLACVPFIWLHGTGFPTGNPGLPMTGEQAVHRAIPTVTSRTTELSLVLWSGSWGTSKIPPGLLAAGTHHLSCHLGVLLPSRSPARSTLAEHPHLCPSLGTQRRGTRSPHLAPENPTPAGLRFLCRQSMAGTGLRHPELLGVHGLYDHLLPSLRYPRASGTCLVSQPLQAGRRGRMLSANPQASFLTGDNQPPALHGAKTWES
uniref:Uncharacterized protein n=1 Tax=Myotis myotis TaxID=51298 RepID=A0A7J7RUU2_MYOMY|nr:hypothetical protein mMyoMyo1_010162 [Myotis myotis]